MHDEIVRISIDGETGVRNIMKERERLIHFLENSMRDDGYVPALDIEPQFSLDEFRPETETYSFTLSVYAIQVGEEQSWQIDGIMGGKMIMPITPPARSKQSSIIAT